MKIVFFIQLLVGLSCISNKVALAKQTQDSSYKPTIQKASFKPKQGPVVSIDEAHNNYHKLSGSYEPLGKLLLQDGFNVRSSNNSISKKALNSVDIMIISNAVSKQNWDSSRLPATSVFSDNEVSTLSDWVSNGGSLLLIADHMPYPGSTHSLSKAFGAIFYNGYTVRKNSHKGHFKFSEQSGLADNIITRGRSHSEKVSSVKVYTGSAFRLLTKGKPLLVLSEHYRVLLPTVEWSFADITPEVDAQGLLMGAAMEFGKGRVVVLAEAAMTTAQVHMDNDVVTRRIGFTDPDAPDNEQFMLNIIRWLARIY